MDEFELFDLSANKSISQIKRMQYSIKSNEYDTDEALEEAKEIYHQAIRYYFSRLLMYYPEEEPLECDIALETPEDMGLSTNDKLHIIKLSQTPCEGYINIWFYGDDDWSDIDTLDDDAQLNLLEKVLEEF